MKALTIRQPWASAISFGMKAHETRSWGTKYRGDLLICSGKMKSYENEEHSDYLRRQRGWESFPLYKNLPFGRAICIVKLLECRVITSSFISQQTRLERINGFFQVGRIAWIFDEIRSVEPFTVTGRQGLFDVDPKKHLNRTAK